MKRKKEFNMLKEKILEKLAVASDDEALVHSTLWDSLVVLCDAESASKAPSTYLHVVNGYLARQYGDESYSVPSELIQEDDVEPIFELLGQCITDRTKVEGLVAAVVKDRKGKAKALKEAQNSNKAVTKGPLGM